MAGYMVKIDMPNLAPGEVVNISGLGDFANGETTEVTEEQADQFRAYNAGFAPGTYDWSLGPTLEEAFKGSERVIVTGAPVPNAPKEEAPAPEPTPTPTPVPQETTPTPEEN